MFTPSTSISDWRDLQEKTCRLFSEMDYVAEISKQVSLAGRGKKEIDVFVTDPNASYNKTYLIECKFWDSRVNQEVVHAFKTVMEETGANTGFIVSKVGFQSGAHEAARFTNIKLLTFDELQHLYGNEWFRKQRAKLEVQIQRLRHISTLHFDQWNDLGFSNNIWFRSPEQRQRLNYFNRWMLNLILNANGRWPKSYADTEPGQIPSDPMNPDLPELDEFTFQTVRDYFIQMTNAAKSCADDFDVFLKEAQTSFNSLPKAEQGDARLSVIAASWQELPLRVLRRYIDEEEYARLLNLVMRIQPHGQERV